MGATPDSSVSIPASALAAGLVQVWRGANVGTPLDMAATQATGGTGMPDPPAATTVTPAALRIIIGFHDQDISASVLAPSGFSDLLARDTAEEGTGVTVMIASAEAASIGALNPAAFGGPGNDTWEALHFALRPGGDASEGDVAFTEAADTITAAASLLINADATLNEAADIVTQGVVGVLQEAPDTISATGSLLTTGNATLTEDGDTFVAIGQRTPGLSPQGLRDIGFPQEACDEDIALVAIYHADIPDEGHPAMPGGVLFLTDGIGEFDDDLNCYTLTVGGQPYICGPIDIIEPGESEEDPRGKIIVPNVDSRIGNALEQIHSRPTVNVTIVLGSDPYAIIGGPYDGLELHNVEGDGLEVQGDISWPILRNEPWPKDTVRPSKYRAAFRALS